MPKNNGLKNEIEILETIDGHTYNELSNNAKHIVNELFGCFTLKDKFKAEKLDDYIKPDISITYRGETHYISIKSGSADTVHSCMIKDFILYIREYGITKKTQSTILKYQYGDGTLTGTGEKRLPYVDVVYLLKDDIAAANIEINSNLKLLNDFIEIALFIGKDKSKPAADFIYFGNSDYGTIVSKTQILKHIFRESRKYNHLNNPHIGPLLYTPQCRYVDHKDTKPIKRHIVQFKWPHLENELKYIFARYNK